MGGRGRAVRMHSIYFHLCFPLCKTPMWGHFQHILPSRSKGPPVETSNAHEGDWEPWADQRSEKKEMIMTRKRNKREEEGGRRERQWTTTAVILCRDKRWHWYGIWSQDKPREDTHAGSSFSHFPCISFTFISCLVSPWSFNTFICLEVIGTSFLSPGSLGREYWEIVCGRISHGPEFQIWLCQLIGTTSWALDPQESRAVAHV